MDNPIVLIVEGIDQIGKTTFIDKLISLIEERNNQKYNILYHRDIVQLNSLRKFDIEKTPEFLDEKHIGVIIGTINMFKTLSNVKNTIIVLDRFHITAATYGKVLRNNLKPFEDNMWLEKVIKQYCHPILLGFYVDKVKSGDEVVSSKNLELINKEMISEYDSCSFDQKLLVKLNIDKNGISNIMDFTETIYESLIRTLIPHKNISYFLNLKNDKRS